MGSVFMYTLNRELLIFLTNILNMTPSFARALNLVYSAYRARGTFQVTAFDILIFRILVKKYSEYP